MGRVFESSRWSKDVTALSIKLAPRRRGGWRATLALQMFLLVRPSLEFIEVVGSLMPMNGSQIAQRTAFVVGILIGAGVVDGRAEDEKAKADLEKMQGQWVSTDEQGESIWTFQGNELTLKTPTRSYKIKVSLNPTAEPEKHIDFEVLEDSPDAKGYKTQGIYRFADGGILKICFGTAESGRPKEFKTVIEEGQPESFAFELKPKK
jgi:uncharacterized protein (TIGR03067 family)